MTVRRISSLFEIIALVAMMVFVFTSCEEPAPPPAQLSIVVTDIPNTYNGKYGYVGLTNNTMDSSQLKEVADSLPVTISGGQVKCDLLNEKAALFTEKGTYHCVFIITSDSAGETLVWAGVKLNLKITDVITKITFSNFTAVN